MVRCEFFTSLEPRGRGTNLPATGNDGGRDISRPTQNPLHLPFEGEAGWGWGHTNQPLAKHSICSSPFSGGGQEGVSLLSRNLSPLLHRPLSFSHRLHQSTIMTS